MEREMRIFEARWHGKINLIKIYKEESGMKFSFSYFLFISFITFFSSLFSSPSRACRRQGGQADETARHATRMHARSRVRVDAM